MSDAADELFSALSLAGGDPTRLRRLLGERDPTDAVLATVLLRPVSPQLLTVVAQTAPWSDRPILLGRVAANPRTPRHVALAALPALHWRDLAVVAGTPAVAPSVRLRAELRLLELLDDLRFGDRITLARMATARLFAALLGDSERRVLEACLENPRLREADLALALGRPEASRVLTEATAASPRWVRVYGVRLALVLQTRTPLAIALEHVSSLNPADLRRVAGTREALPLVRAAAETVLERLSSGAKTPTGSDG